MDVVLVGAFDAGEGWTIDAIVGSECGIGVVVDA